ncbi:MAG: [acyl-carrier-protein] S-malonyltransferase [Acholeplasma sp.]|jgi:[acyl-carrier-protein] S-malonyltransferase|nr:MAG: [acyl-carrier-protein] S-malonyltransferase [Acholeplasma sp.]
MAKLALVFSGQGSQYIGMSVDYLDHFLDHEKIGEDVLGYSLRDILLDPEGRIHQTEFTQPLVFLTSALGYEAFKSLHIKPEAVLGFSLGEYSALYASGILNFRDALSLIQFRAKAMMQCANEEEGAMAAILGLKRDEVEGICHEASQTYPVWAANFNSPIQTVISGTKEGVGLAIELAKQKGAKRAIPLQVSGAFHSPLMAKAGVALEKFLTQVKFQPSTLPIYMNVTSYPLKDDQLDDLLVKQIQSPVEFEASILHMKEDGFTHFLEIGPGSVLTGLIKKIDNSLEVFHLDQLSELKDVKGWLNTHGFNQ